MNFYCSDTNDDRFGTKTRRMTIANGGNIGVVGDGDAIYAISDRRLKENITDLSDCLAKINGLQGVSFTWMDGYCDDCSNPIRYGFIAQDVEEVDTKLISAYGEGSLTVGETTIENPKAVNQKFIVPLLVEAVKELSAKNDALEARILTLENA